MRRRPAPHPPPPAGARRILSFVLVLGVFFALPIALFFRLSGTEGSTRVAVQIVAMTLPATGALILRLNPDLVPDRETLRSLSPVAWAALAVLIAAAVAGAWSLAGALG